MTPYLYANGHIVAGIGYDFEVVKVVVGIEGKIVFIDAKVPFNAQILLTPTFENGDIAVKLYLGATLKPRMTLLDAELSLLAELEVPGVFTASYRYVIADFPPLIDRDFGNILPIPMLDLNLVSMSQLMNAVK